MNNTKKSSRTVGQYVNTQHVDTVINTYKKERWAPNSDRMGKPDSLSAWYSLEELEGFIETIKKHDADGIKFYFAVYPENQAPRPEYAGLQTIVLVATKAKETLQGTVNKDLYINQNGSSEILAYNVAHLCPPFCGGGGGFQPGSELGSLGLAIIDKGENGLAIL